jgi:arginyl-tRNA synthetase
MIADRIRQQIVIALQASEIEHSFKSFYDVQLDSPKNKEFGHYSTNLPFSLAKQMKKAPMQLAELIASKMDMAMFEKVEAMKPGFINFKLKPEELRNVIAETLESGEGYGRTKFGGGRRIQVEFVSANPTGPLSVGHGRLAAFGDALASLLTEAGFNTEREFYVNDIGGQIENLAASVELRCRELSGETIDLEELKYKGEYLIEPAQAIVGKYGESLWSMEESSRRALLAEFTIEMMMDSQKKTLKRIGLVFDTWFREHNLHEQGLVEETLERLKARGEAYEKDGAFWFASAEYKDTEDRVLKKSDGRPTYFLADIAYHNNKYQRGYDTVIDIWGADHHGYIGRMKSAVQALGYDPARLEVLIVQLVRFKESGEYVKMSKRAGKMITIDDLVDDVGADMARFFFIARSRESHLDFDLELAKEKSEANPLFYLQYAHARICSLLAKAADAGLAPGAELSKLTDAREFNLMKLIADYPWEIQSAAAGREPHRIINFLTVLAGSFHTFYHDLRVIAPEEAEQSAARLALSAAVRNVIGNGLKLLGVSAPEKM